MPDPDLIGSERDVLLYYLGRMREHLVAASEGLSDAQQREAGVPSGTNLLGLIQHMSDGEIHWFQTVFLGDGPEVTFSMDVPTGKTRAEVVAGYEVAARRTDEIVRATPDLSTLAAASNPGEPAPVALRRILTHMIRETARHCGHADILREQIDGVTSD